MKKKMCIRDRVSIALAVGAAVCYLILMLSLGYSMPDIL